MIHTSCIRRVNLGRHAYGTSCSCDIYIQDELVLLHHWFRGVSPRHVKQQICAIADQDGTALDTMQRYHEKYIDASVSQVLGSKTCSQGVQEFYRGS